jgi:hypothetical protein
MPKPKLSPEGEVIAAYGTAMVAAFQVLAVVLRKMKPCIQGSFQRRSPSIWKWSRAGRVISAT